MKFEVVFTLFAALTVVSCQFDAGKFKEIVWLKSGAGDDIKEIALSKASFSFEGSSAFCRENDMELFAINDQETYAATAEFLKTKSGLPSGPNNGVWINGRRDPAKVWYSYTGAGPDKKPVFVDGVPWGLESSTGEPYLSFVFASGSFKYSPNRGTKTLPTVCQRKNIVTTTKAPPTTTTTKAPVTTTAAPTYDEAFCKKNCGFYTDSVSKDLQKTILELTAQLEAKDKKIADLEAANAQKQKEITTLLEEKRACLAAGLEKDKKIDELNIKIAQALQGDAANKALQKQLDECNANVQKLTTDITDRDVKISTLQAQVTAKTKEVEEANTKYENAKKELADARKINEDSSVCQKQLNEWIQKYKDSEAKRSLDKSQYEEKIASLQKTITDLQAEITNLRAEIKRIQPDGPKPSTDMGPIMANLASAVRLLEILVNYIKVNNVPVPDWDLFLKDYQRFLDNLYIRVNQNVDVKPDDGGGFRINVIKIPDIVFPYIRITDNIDSSTNKPVEGSKVTTYIVENKPLIFIPKGLDTSYPELRNLYIIKSQLEILQVGDLDGFNKVVDINLSGNYLKVIKNYVFDQVVKLEKLDLSYNQITSIDRNAFGNLIELQEIRLNNNKFASLEYHLFTFNAKLINIYFQNNGLILIDRSLMQFFRKRHTDLTNNECIDLAFPIVGPAANEEFCVEPTTSFKCGFAVVENVYQCVGFDVNINKQEYAISRITGAHVQGKSSGDIRGLIIQKQRLSYIPRGLAGKLSTVEEVYIENSGLKGLYNTDFKGFRGLRKVTIFQNNIKIIEDDVFTFNTALTHVILSDNKITAVPAKFLNKNTQLKFVDLSKNEITSVKYTLVPKVNTISHFSLGSNRLTLVEQALVQRMKKTKYVDFTNNNCISSIITLGIEGTRTADELMGIIQCRCVLNPSIDCEGGDNDE